MNKLIANYAYLKHGIILGEKTCEDLKINLLHFRGEDTNTMVRGKSLETGLPKSVRIKTSDIKEALLPPFNQIIDAIKEMIEISPPEIADEVFKNGITLTGNMAESDGLNDYFSEELKIPVNVAKNPADITLNGLMAIERDPDAFFKLFGYK